MSLVNIAFFIPRNQGNEFNIWIDHKWYRQKHTMIDELGYHVTTSLEEDDVLFAVLKYNGKIIT